MEAAPRSEEDSPAGGGGGERRMVWWERLLPRRRSLRVLLVESDDSTRHIVAALLRKCSYQVAAAADGMKAWEALKERRGGIDLVLSEVATPSLSGIGLLSKIMSDEQCKNIPVIMMSSHDSIGVVLKCMLKGAVDFLVKPVRKNELRNLWQHVWRRHCSSGHMNASDNNAASNHISANAVDRSETGENSDTGTDTQSSGSKPGVEIRSLEEHVEPELAEGRSLAKEVDRGENPDNNVMLLPTLSKTNAGGETTGKLVEVGVRNTVGSLQISVAAKLQDQNHPCDVSPYEKADVYYVRSREGEKVDLETDTQNNVPSESMQDWFNFSEPIASKRCSSFVPKKVHNENTHVQNIPNSEMPLSPSCDLSMRKPQFNGGVHKELKQRHLLNHSDSSAFSRYGDKRIHSSCQKSISSASCTRLGESVEKFQPHVNSHNPEYFRIATFPAKDSLPRVNLGEDATHLRLSCGTNKFHAGLLPPGLSREDNCLGQSSTQESSNLHPHFGFISMPVPFGATLYLGLHGGYGAFQRPMFSSGTTLSPNYSAVETATVEIPSDKPGQDDNAFTNHLHEESQGHWITSDMDPRDKRDFPCCAMERTNQSASCMQDVFRGSGSNGSREPTDVAGNVGNTLESGNESGIQSCDREGLFSHCSRREAALLKFRSKRKDRCYEKKVRYHNRKKLAEQRPRVKGQFVRQKILEPMMATEDD